MYTLFPSPKVQARPVWGRCLARQGVGFHCGRTPPVLAPLQGSTSGPSPNPVSTVFRWTLLFLWSLFSSVAIFGYLSSFLFWFLFLFLFLFLAGVGSLLLFCPGGSPAWPASSFSPPQLKRMSAIHGSHVSQPPPMVQARSNLIWCPCPTESRVPLCGDTSGPFSTARASPPKHLRPSFHDLARWTLR